jgi:hypothetical protein
VSPAQHKRNGLAEIAMPLLRRLTDDWQSEERATEGLTFGVASIEAAVRGGFAQRRRHWLTRQWQVRLTVPAYDRHRLGLATGGAQ